MTVMIILPLLLFPTNQLSMGEKFTEVSLESLINHFQLKHPLIVCNEDFWNLRLVKMMMKNYHYSFVKKNIPYSQESVKKSDWVFIDRKLTDMQKIFKFIKDMKQNSKAVIICENVEAFMKVLEPTIDKQVYFVKESSMEVYEGYKINMHDIRRKLGQFDSNKFIWEENVNHNFIERRSNFHGLHLKAMTESNGNELILRSGFEQNANYHSNNETYLVTNYASGLYHDILKEVQSQLNFTTSLYKRKVVAWGLVYPLANGSFDATGMVGDLFFQRVDLVVASLTIIKERALYIDMLMPIASENVGLYIQSQNSKGTFDFRLLFLPFRY